MANTFFRIMGFSGWMALVTAFLMAVGYDPNNNGYRLLFWIIVWLVATVTVARAEDKVLAWVHRQLQRKQADG